MSSAYSSTHVYAVLVTDLGKTPFDHDVDKYRQQIAWTQMYNLFTVVRYIQFCDFEVTSRAEQYQFEFRDDQASSWHFYYPFHSCNSVHCRTTVQYQRPCCRTSTKKERNDILRINVRRTEEVTQMVLSAKVNFTSLILNTTLTVYNRSQRGYRLPMYGPTILLMDAIRTTKISFQSRASTQCARLARVIGAYTKILFTDCFRV